MADESNKMIITTVSIFTIGYGILIIKIGLYKLNNIDRKFSIWNHLFDFISSYYSKFLFMNKKDIPHLMIYQGIVFILFSLVFLLLMYY